MSRRHPGFRDTLGPPVPVDTCACGGRIVTWRNTKIPRACWCQSCGGESIQVEQKREAA